MAWLALAPLLWGSPSHADVPLARLRSALETGRLERALARGAWIERGSGRRVTLSPSTLSRLPTFSGRAPSGGAPAFFDEGPSWTPPRRLALDRARPGVRWSVPAPAGSGSGQGVVVGILDTGLDVTHPDFRHADGTTRVAWLLDLSADPAGTQPELEAALGCEPRAGARCRVLSGADIDARLTNDVSGDEPSDDLGHGTHVASLAAGSGAPHGQFIGMAPEATLVIVDAVSPSATLTDADIVAGTRFVFERAEALGMPAVVNLSLGSDFGPHGAGSRLGRALAELVGPEYPGRAIVVAAGNGGALLTGLTDPALEPLGIHTEAELTPGRATRLPLLTPPPTSGAERTDATLYLWIELSRAADVALGVEAPGGLRVEPVRLGGAEGAADGELELFVLHGTGNEAQALEWAEHVPLLAGSPPVSGAAVIIVDGRWLAGEPFTIVLEGEGRADLWVQSEGDLSPAVHPLGALFARATNASTVMIPAAHPDLIAVGASINRSHWVDRTGADVALASDRFGQPLTLGTAAFFSAAGPSTEGRLKPDLVAPGGFVVGALAAQADPRRDPSTVFADPSVCEPRADCQIVDELHAVTGGTSMAAPLVTGAVALLLAHDPTLTQAGVRDRLQATALELPPAHAGASRDGAGALAVADALDSMLEGLAAGAPDAARSRLVASRALPPPGVPLELLLQLRDANGASSDVALERLRLVLRGGLVSAPLEHAAPGLYRALVVPEPGGAHALGVDFELDGAPWLSTSLPVAGGPALPAHDSGGCSVSPSAPPFGASRWGHLALGALAAFAGRARRRASAVAALASLSLVGCKSPDERGLVSWEIPGPGGRGGAGFSGAGGSGAAGTSSGGSAAGGAAGASSSPSDAGPDGGVEQGIRCPALGDGVVTDFTSGADDDPADFRFGADGRLSGSLFAYPTAPSAYALDSRVEDGEWHLAGAVGDYSGFGLLLACDGIEASRFRGIAFKLRGTIEAPGALRLVVTTAAHEVSHVWLNEHASPGEPPARPRFGTCKPAGDRYDGSCVPASAPVSFDGESEVEIRWEEFSGGSPEPGVRPSRLVTDVRWSLSAPEGVASDDVTPYAIDLYLDDLRFVPAAP